MNFVGGNRDIVPDIVPIEASGRSDGGLTDRWTRRAGGGLIQAPASSSSGVGKR